MGKCGCKTEVYSRVAGYFRSVNHWNRGKKEEFKDRKTYKYNYDGSAITPLTDKKTGICDNKLCNCDKKTLKEKVA